MTKKTQKGAGKARLVIDPIYQAVGCHWTAWLWITAASRDFAKVEKRAFRADATRGVPFGDRMLTNAKEVREAIAYHAKDLKRIDLGDRFKRPLLKRLGNDKRNALAELARQKRFCDRIGYTAAKEAQERAGHAFAKAESDLAGTTPTTYFGLLDFSAYMRLVAPMTDFWDGDNSAQLFDCVTGAIANVSLNAVPGFWNGRTPKEHKAFMRGVKRAAKAWEKRRSLKGRA